MWITLAIIMELIWVIGIISYIKDEHSREFFGGYIFCVTITNIIGIVFLFKHFM